MIWRRLPRVGLIGALVGMLIALSGASGALHAAGTYAPGTTGTSIGLAQCGGDYPASPQAFAIVAVSGGRAFYQNPCLVSEYHWAQAATAAPSLYMNLNAPAGTTAFKALAGPKGACQPSDDSCAAYNYGYNAAQSAFADAQSQGTTASNWWLDVETENSWSDTAALNDQTIQAAIDFLQGQGITVGLYSTASQWRQIAGSYSPGLSNWVAGAADSASAASFCAPAQAFGGGAVQLVQYPARIGDNVFACPPPGSAAAPATVPAAPTGVIATAADANSIQLTWTETTPSVDSFVVTDGSTDVGQTAGNVMSFTVSGLLPGSFHCYAVTAHTSAGYSGWSAYACATTPAAS